jgi:hypothetical protein
LLSYLGGSEVIGLDQVISMGARVLEAVQLFFVFGLTAIWLAPNLRLLEGNVEVYQDIWLGHFFPHISDKGMFLRDVADLETMPAEVVP